jgi:hypothetical protein
MHVHMYTSYGSPENRCVKAASASLSIELSSLKLNMIEFASYMNSSHFPR